MTMNPDDVYQKARDGIKISSKDGLIYTDITNENLVKGGFESKDEKSGKIIDNQRSTVEETWRMFDLHCAEAHKRGFRIAGCPCDKCKNA